jgi:hypothetical protein
MRDDEMEPGPAPLADLVVSLLCHDPAANLRLYEGDRSAILVDGKT